jgi:CRISPR-associated protein Cas6
MNGAVAEVLDLAFVVSGGPIERDYADALHAQLLAALPWLDEEPRAGVHPLRGVTPADGRLLLGARTRLTLRVPGARVDECLVLQDRVLALHEPLRVGRAQPRSLLPYRTLYSPLVVTGDESETPFLRRVQDTIAAWGAACQVIVGRAGERHTGAGDLHGFSVMLHGVTPELSLRAQQEGVGGYRGFGCGLFVPHRSADALAP